jgi:hypothetical protein
LLIQLHALALEHLEGVLWNNPQKCSF